MNNEVYFVGLSMLEENHVLNLYADIYLLLL
jgi:hypothetical protein